MKCLLVTAHPLTDSLCAALAERAAEALSAAGHEVILEDLYRENFEAELTVAERQSYYRPPYNASAVEVQVARLLEADAIVLVFPTWWFGFPAILKGWFDRVWGPGVAYDHADDFGPIKPRLHGLKRMLVVTTLGSPWWVDWLLLRRPVRNVLKIALLGTCAPGCKFRMLSLYRSEKLSMATVERFSQRVVGAIQAWD